MLKKILPPHAPTPIGNKNAKNKDKNIETSKSNETKFNENENIEANKNENALNKENII